MTEHEGIKQDDCMRERTMSDGITDAERMKREEVERWRKMVKEQFVSELSTAELVGELCKRDAVLERLHIWFENYCEGNEDPDLWMAFLHAERTLRQAGEPDA